MKDKVFPGKKILVGDELPNKSQAKDARKKHNDQIISFNLKKKVAIESTNLRNRRVILFKK